MEKSFGTIKNAMDIDKIQKEANEELAQVQSIEDLEAFRNKYLGRGDGRVTVLLRSLKDATLQNRRIYGPKIQTLRAELETAYLNKLATLSVLGGKGDSFIFEPPGQTLTEKVLTSQAESLSYKWPKIGHLHPVTRTVRMMNEHFRSMGYSVMDGPEIESDEYCFQRLNVPLDHPARDMQDTIYIEEPNFLLRTQTSSIEARVLEQCTPPFRVVCPGLTYRNEKASKTNHFIFHQYQGIVVQERITLRDLFGTITSLFQKLYGPDVVVRFRNKYYPEVEPGVGPDMQCFNCRGQGCGVCKGVGWIEMGGAGIIHPNVLKQAGLSPRQWMGFAFGLGLDRWIMAKYKITDIRTLLGGNLAYHYYFNEGSI